MKQSLFSIIIIAASINCSAQNNISPNHKEYPLVHVKDWSSKSMIIADEIWNSAKPEIVAQIGEKGFEDVRNNYDWKSIPSQMSIVDGKKKKNLEELNEKLAGLKVYKMATYKHIFDGKYWGEFVILQVPYKGNEMWDSTAKWKTVYFIMKKESIETINSSQKLQ